MSTEPVDTSSGDIVVTDKELFDHAISDAPASGTPAPVQTEAPPSEPQPVLQQPEAVPRDEQGRFAPKPQGAATTQQSVEPPEAFSKGQPPQQQPPQQRPTEDHRVPLATLMQERERAYRAEAELQQMRQAWAQHQAAAQQQQQQPQGPETIFDGPDEYLTQRYMNPLRQEGYTMMLQMKDGLSREFANTQFGEEQVNTALQAISQIRQTPQGNFVFQQIMNSGHPYGALVKWHQQARAQQAIGSDPQAWLRQKQQEWVRDPNAQQAVLQHLRQQQQTSGRPPNVSLPPSLSSVPSSSGRLDDQGDLSNESLYRFATK